MAEVVHIWEPHLVPEVRAEHGVVCRVTGGSVFVKKEPVLWTWVEW